MIKIVIFVALVALASARPQLKGEPQVKVVRVPPTQRPPTDAELEQNRNAQYKFSTNIKDGINDQSQMREEVRDGVNVKGMYSYSDGFFRRTVRYEADEKGYRVTGEEVVPLEGPVVDLSGTASVDTAAHGTSLKYSVKSVPAEGPISKVVDKVVVV